MTKIREKLISCFSCITAPVRVRNDRLPAVNDQPRLLRNANARQPRKAWVQYTTGNPGHHPLNSKNHPEASNLSLPVKKKRRAVMFWERERYRYLWPSLVFTADNIGLFYELLDLIFTPGIKVNRSRSFRTHANFISILFYTAAVTDVA